MDVTKKPLSYKQLASYCKLYIEMIALISGEVIEYEDSHVVIDCGGIGYDVYVCFDELQNLQIGKKCQLYIAEQIKEDAHNLFGFSQKSRRELFMLLISVNGIGPKAGMAILNIGSESQVRSAIASGDTRFITAAQGVGKKVAERVVVDLKNKVGLEASDGAVDFLSDTVNSDEAVEALVALGYSAQDAVELLRGVDNKLTTSERLKLALKGNK
jgi:holliday junction DNA helicase RuvA